MTITIAVDTLENTPRQFRETLIDAITEVRQGLSRRGILHFTAIARRARHIQDEHGHYAWFCMMEAFIQSSAMTQRFVMRYIQAHENQARFRLIAEACVILNRENGLYLSHFNVLVDHEKPREVAQAILNLIKVGGVSEGTLMALRDAKDPGASTDLIQRIMNEFPSLDTNLIGSIVNGHSEPEERVLAIMKLSEHGLLNDPYIRMIREHIHYRELADAFCWLHQRGLLTSENCRALNEWTELSASFLEDIKAHALAGETNQILQWWFDKLLSSHKTSSLPLPAPSWVDEAQSMFIREPAERRRGIGHSDRPPRSPIHTPMSSQSLTDERQDVRTGRSRAGRFFSFEPDGTVAHTTMSTLPGMVN